MNNLKKVLLLIGSPKSPKGASDFIGSYFLTYFGIKGLMTRKETIYNMLKDKDGANKLISYVTDSDILLFSCPLYFDWAPYPVIKAMEIITELRKKVNIAKKQKFFVLLNCGYPEADHNVTAMHMYRQFAAEAGFEWAGGLAIGMGPLVNMRSFFGIDFLLKNFKKMAEKISNILIDDQPIDTVRELMVEPFIPLWLYFVGEHVTARILAAKNGVFWRLGHRPYG